MPTYDLLVLRHKLKEFQGCPPEKLPAKSCRARLSVLFRPYDLVVVRREEIEPEYFTISATGVMHIRKGVQSDFTPLGEWMREKTMFDLISKIKYFRTYLVGRCFRRWKQVRHCSSCQQP